MTSADTRLPLSNPGEGAPRFLGVRLGVQIFLAFAVMGAWLPVFSRYLSDLQFSPEATAWASATNAIGALIAPLIWGQIADRWLAMERCISLCACLSGIGLWCLTRLSEPAAVFGTCVAIWFFLIPVVGLTSSFIFRQLEHPERDYGKIRLWGTLGWMAANWSLTWWFEQLQEVFQGQSAARPDYADSLRLGGWAAFAVAFYALTLPHTPPRKGCAGVEQTWLGHLAGAPLSALALFRNRSFLVYCLCIFGFYITMPFPIQLNPLLLSKLKVGDKMLPTILTVSQVTELIALFLLPLLLARLGSKRAMMVGCAMWTVGMGLLSIGEPVWLVLTALATHGLFISCFVIAGQLYVNQQATHDIRASAQGLLTLMTGSGLLLGHLLVGWIRDLTADSFGAAYLTAACLSGSLVLVFLAGFTADGPASSRPKKALVPGSEMT